MRNLSVSLVVFLCPLPAPTLDGKELLSCWKPRGFPAVLFESAVLTEEIVGTRLARLWSGGWWPGKFCKSPLFTTGCAWIQL